MKNDQYRYDKNTLGQMPPQQPSTHNYPGIYMNQPPGAPQALKAQQTRDRSVYSKTTAPARMPKARALSLVRFFKRSLVVMSLATFASISGLVAYHQMDNSASSQKSSTSTTSASQQQNNTFLNQQGDNHLGTSTPVTTATPDEPTATATTNSGSSNGSNANPSSGPVSGSHTS